MGKALLDRAFGRPSGLHILDLDPNPIVTVRNVGYLLDPDRLPP